MRNSLNKPKATENQQIDVITQQSFTIEINATRKPFRTAIINQFTRWVLNFLNRKANHWRLKLFEWIIKFNSNKVERMQIFPFDYCWSLWKAEAFDLSFNETVQFAFCSNFIAWMRQFEMLLARSAASLLATKWSELKVMEIIMKPTQLDFVCI